MLGDILAGFQLFDRFKNKYFNRTQATEPFSTITQRLVALFESHGVHRNQIEEFFGHGLDIPSCTTDDELLKKLTPEIITDAAKLFGVNKDWLEGSSNEIYNIPDFYKHPEDFDFYLTELLNNTNAYKPSAYVLTSHKKSIYEYNDSLFVIAEPIGEINQREIYKYHLLGRWGIHYWKSRAYFTACCALLYKHGFLVTGKFVEPDWLSKVYEGQELLSYDFDERYGGVNFPTIGSWIVSDFVEMPDSYLKGLNTRDGHSVQLAIEKWLSLSEKGYMRCFPDEKELHAGVEESFEQKLKNLRN
ncbi:hypothetical protein Q4506_00620 [Colwellia sp. 4_MG-2023]|uniref:hypothetical protein n=1 Tax=unclassified Colwellia TaxID=196834 RepID=UPI0026E2DFE0|nr:MULTISPECIES: hypothetical protein [unclassified Colwellia]MDO6505546.1 hypothetical protein [Colwellia sp. 5_MG-2023]MDO6554158.1 hypothetical protein [Colwellia sp. 4_MG-2023]